MEPLRAGYLHVSSVIIGYTDWKFTVIVDPVGSDAIISTLKCYTFEFAHFSRRRLYSSIVKNSKFSFSRV